MAVRQENHWLEAWVQSGTAVVDLDGARLDI
jgi:hypothetical protein